MRHAIDQRASANHSNIHRAIFSRICQRSNVRQYTRERINGIDPFMVLYQQREDFS